MKYDVALVLSPLSYFCLVWIFSKMMCCILQLEDPKYGADNFIYSAVWEQI